MKAHGYKSLMAIVVALGLWTTAGASESIPIWEGFEGLSIGPLGPTNIGAITYTGTLAVVDTDAAEGQRSLHMSSDETGSSMIVIVDPDHSNVWTLVYSKPAFNVGDIFNLMAPGDDTALMFGVDTNGAVIATDGAGWATNSVGLDPDIWLGFAVNADYNDGQYDLYLANNALYGGSLQRIFTNLAFNANYTNKFATGFEVSTGLSTFLDAISIEVSSVAVASVGDYVTPALRQAGAFAAPRRVGEGENKFGRELGDMMMAGLSEDDIVRVYFGEADGWEEYVLEEDGGLYSWGGGNTNRAIDPSQGILLVQVANPGGKFIPHSEPGLTEPSASLFEGDDWNLLAWTAPSATPDASSQWHFSHLAAEDDRLIVHDPSTGRAQSFVWRDDAWRNYPRVTQPVDFVMPANRVFWYRGKDTGGGVTWEPDN